MNPIKVFKDSVPALKQVLESIHAHLELQLEVQNKILLSLNKIRTDMEIIIKLQNERNSAEIQGLKQEGTQDKHFAG